MKEEEEEEEEEERVRLLILNKSILWIVGRGLQLDDDHKIGDSCILCYCILFNEFPVVI